MLTRLVLVRLTTEVDAHYRSPKQSSRRDLRSPRSEPKSLHDFVLRMNRWFFRVVTYATLLTVNYPPFRLDERQRTGARHRNIGRRPADTSPCALATCGGMSPSREPVAGPIAIAGPIFTESRS